MNKLLLILVMLASNVYGKTHQVGSTQTYTSPHELYLANVVQEGDTIEIAAEIYTGTAALAVWQPNNLVIKGVGGRPHLIANGQYIWGKGIWVLAGNDITVENMEFSGAAVPDRNGAGIRLDGIGLTVRHCFFHDNENGILTSNPYEGDVLIEFSEFANNGYGDGFSHNLYIGHIHKLTFRFNYSHHAKIGHNLKSRADENYILHNRIMDEETGNSSRLIDLSNGGFAILMGNLLMQGLNAENNNLVGYGKEGLSNVAPHELYFVNNTLVNKRTASCIFLDIANNTNTAVVSNNIFAGTGTTIRGITTSLQNNLVEETLPDLLFEDEPNYDYRLTTNSPAIDYGENLPSVNGFSLIPEVSYEHPTNFVPRIIFNDIDVGAYEFHPSLSIFEPTSASLSIYPNPTTDILNVDMGTKKIDRIEVYNAFGQRVLSVFDCNKIQVSSLVEGLYFVRIEASEGRYGSTRFIKK